MAKEKGISIIISVWNQLGYTKLSVDSMIKNAGTTPFELIIVDNGSRREIRDYFDLLARKIPLRYIRNEENLGPIKAINQGIRAARYSYVMSIHNDVVIFEPDWLHKIISVMEADPRIGIVGLAGRQEIYKAGNVNEATLKHNLQNEEDLCPPMKEETAEVAVIDGLCFVMREALLDSVRSLDETYGYMHCYDFDISLESIAHHFKNVVVKIEAMHLGNGGRTRFTKGYGEFVKSDSDLLKRNYKIFADKWSDLLPLRVGASQAGSDAYVDPSLYSREYFLGDNEGFREWGAGLENAMHPKFKLAFKHAMPSAGDTVLDIGCGRGELIYYCAKRGAKVLGLDYSKAAIEIARETIGRLPGDLRNLASADIGDPVTYRFPDTYDIIYMIEVVEHMHDWQLKATFKKMEAILKPGGRIIITTPNFFYERVLSPLKRVIDIPVNLIKWPARILRGKYKNSGALAGLKKAFRILPDRGELNRQMHVNIMTPSKLRKLLQNFNASVVCEDRSANILSLLTRTWWGRDIIVVARGRQDENSRCGSPPQVPTQTPV